MFFRNISIKILIIIGTLLLITISRYLYKIIKLKINNIKYIKIKKAAWVLIHAANNLFHKKNQNDKLIYISKKLKKIFPWADDSKIKEFIKSILEEFYKK